MRLTTRGRYAVTAMLDLALNNESGPISLADISHRQEISLSYLEQLFAKLRQNNLVSSVRGPGGGYCLARSSDAISVAEIIDAVNESIDATSCSGKGNCHNGDICLTHHLWDDLSRQIHRFLSGISLDSLVHQQDVQVVMLRQSDQADANSGCAKV
ncbi:Fe-S cluster assembly transcriptional regulator IscR [uncultured Porticoccus sp.]|uniref:Fe-S cluster assembly transcriptional regulator IscR n=1 Tax=uncultured Porticoccus sp. TaxID=1256050 RepID=UPI000C0E8CED|nr:MAG: Fe-S cluster assembly transcriptional regulator IscR [Porticoccus sp.]|tara:strand:+ start:1306 stop:1773 length:468 start_codon:yes stop_codon:yes gene_type:complete